MAETTGSLRLVALVVLVIATILSQASALHAQVGETEADRTEALEQAGVEAEGIARPRNGISNGLLDRVWRWQGLASFDLG
jgi:hypothetical protein